MAFLKYSVLALRILIWVLLASLVVFVATSSFAVLHEREQALAAAHTDIVEAVERSMSGVAIALWHYDEPGIKAQLRGMIQTDGLVRVEIGDHRGVLAEDRQASFSGKPDKVWRLPIVAPDGAKEIGFVRVSESYAAVEQRISNSMATLVMSELVKIGGLAIIIFIIVYRKVARHLHDLAEAVSRLNPDDENPQVEIQRAKLGHYRDELDILVEAINRFLAERGTAEASLRERVSEIETTLGALSDGVITLDAQQRISYANKPACALLGLGDYAADKLEIDQVLRVVDERSGSEYPGLCAGVIASRQAVHYRGEVKIRPLREGSAGGLTAFEAKISAVPVPVAGDVSMIFVFTDISAEIAKERKIEFQAFHDPLTRLGNRSMLARDLPRDIARAAETSGKVAVLCLDLDNFKNINDALGHTIGDLMLKQLAERFRQSVAAPGWVTRHGGDEFIVVLPQIASADAAAAVAQRLMHDIAQPFAIEGNELRVTSSIGISFAPEHGSSIGQLISCADLAMYAAKNSGKNAWRIYEENLLKRSTERLSMENGLRVALAEKQLSLVFQPKLHLASGQINAVEALIRWHSPSAGNIPPATFIPVAEETGLINEIGAWVLEEACAAARRMRMALGHDLAVAVNVSPTQFRGEALMVTLNALAAANPDLRGLIEIELTESALSGDIEEVVAKLEAFRGIGLRVAIDDFGTGYSSLAYLKNLPIDILKIDQAFIRDLPQSSQDQAIVGAVVHLGSSFGFEIVAEGVEEQAHVEHLSRLGCDYAQGYWFARPMPEDDLVKLLTKGGILDAHLALSGQ